VTHALTILIVDDDPDDQLQLIEAFREIDPDVVCCTAMNGQEGLKLLEFTTPALLPSLIFLDLNMPRVNGQRFLFELKSDDHLKAIPVVIYSTSSNPKDIKDLMRLGAFDYITKGPDSLVLKEKLTSLILSMSPKS